MHADFILFIYLFIFTERVQHFISENLLFGNHLKSTMDPGRKPLQMSPSVAERSEHTEVGQSFKPNPSPYLKVGDLSSTRSEHTT